MTKKDRALTFNQSNIPCDGSPFLEEEEKKKGKKLSGAQQMSGADLLKSSVKMGHDKSLSIGTCLKPRKFHTGQAIKFTFSMVLAAFACTDP